jgi:hypothetical protein
MVSLGKVARFSRATGADDVFGSMAEVSEALRSS